MSKLFKPAAAAIIALPLFLAGFAASLQAGEAPAGPQISAASSKAMLAVQQAADAQNFDDVIVKAQQALTIAGKTPADTFVAYQFLAVAYNRKGDKPALLTALQGQIDSGYPQPEERTRIANFMTRTAYEMKDYPKSVEYGNALIDSGTAEPDTYVAVGNSLFQQSRFADAIKVLKVFIADQERSGKAPREATLNTLRAAQDKQGDKAGMADTFEKLVVHYPNQGYWEAMLFLVNRDSPLTDRQKLQVYRLKHATQNLKRCSEYGDMADRAMSAGIPGEGLRVLQQGLASGACTEKADRDDLQSMLASATKQVADDKPNLTKLEAEAKASKSGELDAVLGASLFGYGEFPRSIEALARALGKGSLKNPADAQLTMGIAQIQANDKPAALKTFESIKADDAVTQRIARLWALYAR